MEGKKRPGKPKKEAVVSQEVVAVTPPIKKELILEGDPQAQLAFAKKAAGALMMWVKQKPKKVLIRGEQYLEFGDWQIIGRFYGATVGVEWTKPIDKGYEARAVVMRDGVVISSAEAMCTRSERNWKDRDEFMLKSMAQTRASAKALRQAFGWVAELAGMKSTPAEEMGEQYDQTPIKETAIPVVTYDDVEEEGIVEPDNHIDIPTDIPGQKLRIRALLKKRGVDVSDGAACQRYVADETQLELVEANYVEIIRQLES